MSTKETMTLDIVSAQSSIFQGQVRMVSVTGSMGELGIYPGHTALLTSLKPGQIKAILADQTEEVFYMSGGMLEVQPDAVTILADTAARAADIDEAAAAAAVERASRVVSEKAAGVEYSQALVELAESMAQLRAIEMLRKKAGR